MRVRVAPGSSRLTPDGGLAHLGGVDPDHHLEGRLANRIGTPVGVGAVGGTGGDEDGAAGVGGAEQRIETADQTPVGGEVDGQRPFPHPGVDVAHRRQGAQRTGVSDQDVEAAMAPVDRGAHLVGLLEVGQIGGDQGGLAARGADLVVQFLERSPGAGGENEVRALGRVAPGHRRTDAARRPGHQGDAAIQPAARVAALGHDYSWSASRDSCTGTGPPSRSVRGIG